MFVVPGYLVNLVDDLVDLDLLLKDLLAGVRDAARLTVTEIRL